MLRSRIRRSLQTVRRASRKIPLFLGYQLAFGAVLYLLPESATGADKSTVFETWEFNVRNPHWDRDPWFVNYVSPPYWGAAYYVRARERGFGGIRSFVYSVLLSTLFEYSIESFFEPPSYQDLIVTPVAGALIGAFIFEPVRARIKAKPELMWHDHLIMVATDPLGALNGVFDWLFGIKSDIRLQFRPLARAQRDVTGAGIPSTFRGHEVSRRGAPEVGVGLYPALLTEATGRRDNVWHTVRARNLRPPSRRDSGRFPLRPRDA
jgi:hypothetical protein